MQVHLTASVLTAAQSDALVCWGQASPRASHHAAKHVAKQRIVVASAAGSTVCDPSKCGGACLHAGAAASAKAAGSACPVSDPSACPASCSHQNAGAVAANASGH